MGRSFTTRMLERPFLNIKGEIMEKIDFYKLIKDAEISLIRKAMIATKGNKLQAGLLLTLNRTTLVEKLRRYGMLGLDATVWQEVIHE